MEVQENTPPKFHFWLISGNVVVAVEEDNVQSLPMNAILTTDTPEIGLYQLGKAQQALQMSLFQKVDASANVIDVLVINLVHLAHTTEADFRRLPEGMGVQEAPAAAKGGSDEPFNPLEAARAADNVFNFPGEGR